MRRLYSFVTHYVTVDVIHESVTWRILIIIHLLYIYKSYSSHLSIHSCRKHWSIISINSHQLFIHLSNHLTIYHISLSISSIYHISLSISSIYHISLSISSIYHISLSISSIYHIYLFIGLDHRCFPTSYMNGYTLLTNRK